MVAETLVNSAKLSNNLFMSSHYNADFASTQISNGGGHPQTTKQPNTAKNLTRAQTLKQRLQSAKSAVDARSPFCIGQDDFLVY